MESSATILNQAIAQKNSFESFEGMSIPHSILSVIPYDLAIEYFVLPFGIDAHGRIQALMAYPGDAEALQCVQLHTGACIRPVEAPKDALMPLIAKHYGALASVATEKKERDDASASSQKRLAFNQTSSTITVVNDIIHEAIRLRASDIHLEPFEREMLVRFRIDGVLQEMMTVPKDRVLEVTSRLKIMSRLNIAEKRRSQDGRIRINENNKNVDIRVSTMPTDFGEKIVLRLLDKSAADYTIDSIGMDAPRLLQFKKAVGMPNGIVLLTGPTGSGKTTTLYGVINYIRKPGLNIATIEDPIEYNITGVNQTQVNLHTGMSFAFSLRTLLRQDPDIIMVGEMRDQETAEIAIRASLTGHLVLSTLHTNDAPSAITRLVDMGIEPYLVSSSLTMVVAQRLVRKICTKCKCEDSVPAETRKNIGLPEKAVVYRGVGCSACGYTGYKGRIGIFEVMPITESVRQLINKKASVADIRNQALAEGMVVLRDDALSKLVDGMTTIEEVSRETAMIS
jgi:type IV pilus assembly protein PilB